MGALLLAMLFRQLGGLGLLAFKVSHGNRPQVGSCALGARVFHLISKGARRDGAGEAGGGFGSNIRAFGDLEAEDGRAAACRGRDTHRQIALDGMQPEARLVAVVLERSEEHTSEL